MTTDNQYTLENLENQTLTITTRGHRVPLYVSVYDVIYGLIKSGELKTGDKIPSENYLSEKLGVGRSTVRMAILVLQEDGILVTHHGKGTFVAEVQKRPYIKSHGLGYFVRDLIESSGSTYECRDGSYDIIPHEDFLNEKLGIVADDRIGMILKTHLSNGETVAFSQDFFKVTAELLTADNDFGAADALFEELVRSRADRISMATAPANPTDDVRRRLGVGSRDPVLLVRYEVFQNDLPIVFSKHYFNTARIDYGVTLEV